MDFLDPKKQRSHTIRLMIGYVLVGLAILIGTTILLFAAYGFGLGKDQQVIQKGFVYVSSQPSPAQVYLNGQLNKSATNTRLSLVSGEYYMQLKRSGYRDWQREITVVGGTVEHYDYPFLFPQNLVTTNVKAYTAAPSLATQSLDQRWLIVAEPGAIGSFDEYDLKNPKQAPIVLTLPDGVLSGASSTEGWQLVQWSNDNVHVLLQHTFDGSSEYVMLDRQDPTQSFNLTNTLGTNPTAITLRDQKYDQYYLYDTTSHALQTATLKDPTPISFLTDVYGYKDYGSDMMLYATTDKAPTGKVVINLIQGGTTYQLRTAAAGTTYMLDLAQHNGDWFVAAGASSEDRVYIYKDPVAQLQSDQNDPPIAVPIQILKVSGANYLAFSSNTQFIVDEGGTNFAVYDDQNDALYNYTVASPMDSGQAHATWMDGSHLEYTSGGKLLVFDFDRANIQTLMSASPNYQPFYGPSYKFVDSLATPSSDPNQTVLTTTALLTPQDQ